MRRRRILGLGLLALVLVAGAVVWSVTAGDDEPSAAAPLRIRAVRGTPVPVRLMTGAASVGFTFSLRFPETRRVLRADLTVDGTTARTDLAPLDGRDLDGPLPRGPITLAAGKRLQVEGGSAVRCGGSVDLPALTLTSRPVGGRTVRHRYVPADVAAYRKAFVAGCRAGVQTSVFGSRQNTDGTFTVSMRVANPGPGPATVVSAAYERSGTRWVRATVVVPEGGSRTLTIPGSGDGCMAATPWATGHLTANGKRLSIRAASGEQC